jgi:hypothetical protein
MRISISTNLLTNVKSRTTPGLWFPGELEVPIRFSVIPPKTNFKYKNRAGSANLLVFL